MRSIKRGLAVAAVIAVAAVMPAAASARTLYATESATSSNWAGYVADGTTFSSVSGSWTVPRAKSSSEGYSAMWVGLGGASDSSSALEQVGTESDYVDGQATYSAWYELVPKAPVTLKLKISPGDHISANVTVNGTRVTLRLSDLTTGKSVTKTLHMSDPDISSAEWIAEAPSVETGLGASQVVPLADFGKATFTQASATAGGHTGAITDANWSTERVDLVSSGGPYVADVATAEATTSSLKSGGTSFSVTSNAADQAPPYRGGGWGWRGGF
jgi:peptidase A4-like protein